MHTWAHAMWNCSWFNLLFFFSRDTCYIIHTYINSKLMDGSFYTFSVINVTREKKKRLGILDIGRANNNGMGNMVQVCR